MQISILKQAFRQLCIVVGFALVAQAAVQRVSFKTAKYTARRALIAAVADFNRDGKMDLAIASADFSEILIRLGNGDGTFQPAAVYPMPAAPSYIAVGDFNGDGKMDLAVADYGSSPGFFGTSVSILLGNGDGTFQAAVDYGVGLGPQSIALGDFRGIGVLDLAVDAPAFTNTLSILLGNGDGTFQPQVDYSAGLSPLSVAVGDFNGDGKQDLVVANAYPYAGTISILPGNGDGTFRPPVTYAAGPNPVSVIAADFNGDGKLDLAVANSYLGIGTVILLGNGDGTFRQGASYAAGGAREVVGDFNGDGYLDLVVANGSGVTVLLGRGDGTFQSQILLAGPHVTSVAVGDFNGDGKPDLVVTNSDFGDILVLTNTTP